MPAYFQLISKTTQKPVPFAEIDDELCKAMGVEPHDTDFLRSWYDIIGLRLALGRSFEEIQAEFEERKASAADNDNSEFWTDMNKILQYIRENYDSTAWYQYGR